MAILFALLSIVPGFVSFLATGDFPQMIFKPPRPLVESVFKYRILLIAGSVTLYLVALLLYFSGAPTGGLVLFVAALRDLFFIGGAFYVVPLIMFPVMTRNLKWVDADQSGLLPDDEI